MSKKEQTTKKTNKAKKAPRVLFDPYDYKKQSYKGVTIYTKSLPWANCTFFKWMIDNGAQDERRLQRALWPRCAALRATRIHSAPGWDAPHAEDPARPPLSQRVCGAKWT